MGRCCTRFGGNSYGPVVFLIVLDMTRFPGGARRHNLAPLTPLSMTVREPKISACLLDSSNFWHLLFYRGEPARWVMLVIS